MLLTLPKPKRYPRNQHITRLQHVSYPCKWNLLVVIEGDDKEKGYVDFSSVP